MINHNENGDKNEKQITKIKHRTKSRHRHKYSNIYKKVSE